MKIMKISERYLWIAGIILAAFMVQNQINNNNNLQTLLQTYEAETNIQDAQISDYNSQIAVIQAESYSQGFEAGKTQAGIALARGGSLYDYADGYHAAIGQNIEEADILEVSAGLMAELSSLRQMVPRLLNQVEKITAENEALTSTEDYLLTLLLDSSLKEEEIDNTYLEIIDLLLSSPSLSTAVSLEDTPFVQTEDGLNVD